jgi:hypothetical protein
VAENKELLQEVKKHVLGGGKIAIRRTKLSWKSCKRS